MKPYLTGKPAKILEARAKKMVLKANKHIFDIISLPTQHTKYNCKVKDIDQNNVVLVVTVKFDKHAYYQDQEITSFEYMYCMNLSEKIDKFNPDKLLFQLDINPLYRPPHFKLH